VSAIVEKKLGVGSLRSNEPPRARSRGVPENEKEVEHMHINTFIVHHQHHQHHHHTIIIDVLHYSKLEQVSSHSNFDLRPPTHLESLVAR
jgi:hypothetical protein